MGTNEYSQPASKSSWDSQDFGDVNMVVKMAHFHKSSRPQWVNDDTRPSGHISRPTPSKCVSELLSFSKQYSSPIILYRSGG